MMEKIDLPTKNKMYSISIKRCWFNAIKQHKKLVEGRLNKGIFSRLRKGNIVKWFYMAKGKKTATFSQIIAINKYKSFESMLRKETLHRTLPGITTIEKGVDVYRQFYTQHDERKFGVLAIVLKPIKNYRMSFKDPPGCPLLDSIISGQKTVEGRVNHHRFHKMRKNDIISFITPNREVICLITYIKFYQTLREYLDNETVAKTIPCVSTIEEAIEIYDGFYKSKKIAEQKRQDALNHYGYGFVAIGIKYIM